MMKQSIYLTLALGLTLASCSKDQLSERSVLPPLSEQQSELDRWCQEHITRPYQAEVIYRWDRNYAERSTHTYPPRLEQVRPVLEALEATVLSSSSPAATSSLPILYCAFTSTVVLTETDKAWICSSIARLPPSSYTYIM